MRFAASAFLTVLLVLTVMLTDGRPIHNNEDQSSLSPAQPELESLNEKVAIHICPDGRTSGKHIVEVQEGRPRSAVLALIKSKVIEIDLVNSFIGFFDTETLDAIRSHPHVSFITEECFMEIASTPQIMPQQQAPWGLARLTSSKRLRAPSDAITNPQYTYNNPHSDGSCADVYILDSGINIHHVEFQGRAFWGASFGDYGVNATVDENGHGTHVAGIVGSASYGVAKGVRLIAVKVTGGEGRNIATGNMVQGMDWISQHSAQTGRPSIVNISIGTNGYKPELNRAAAALIQRGIHVVACAGNWNKDAYNDSPVSVPSVITVGASNIRDKRFRESNYGRVIDIFAPGEDIMSTYIGSDTATMVRSGTSMAAPHVSGWAASYHCSLPPGPLVPPKLMLAKVKEYSLKKVLTEIRECISTLTVDKLSQVSSPGASQIYAQ